MRRLPLAALLAGLAVSAWAPAGLGAQATDPPPASPASPADTVVADTVPPDTTPPTPRDRALERLRALPDSPVQAVAEDAEDAENGEVAEDAEVAEVAEVAENGVVPDVVPEAPSAVPGVPFVRGVREDAGEPVREDSVRRLLRSLGGFDVTEYRGEGAVFEGEESRLRLTGKSRVARDGYAMDADSVLTYSGERGIVCGYGNPVLTGDTDPLHSDRVCYDLRRDLGMADRARTTFSQVGATWYVGGPRNRVFLSSRGESTALYGERAQFTSCELEEPHYTFQAQSLKMLQSELLVARNVTLRFADVPVFWLPWMVQDMRPDRRSGLLMPEFGVNDIVRNSSGYNRSVSNIGFFWAINDYMTARTTFEWFSNNYTAVQGSFNYRWLQRFLNGHVNVRHFWHESEFGPGRRDLTINTSNNWQPDERTRIQLSGDYATSTALVRDYSFDPRELNRRIASSASINRSFAWGSATVGAQRQQQISDDRTDWTLPSLNLSVRPITLFSNADGTQALTWSGSGSANRRLRQVNEMLPGARNRDQERITAGASHTLSFGRLSLSQNVNYEDITDAFKPALDAPPDTVALPETSAQAMTWGTNLGYLVTLRPGTTLTPNLSVSGRQISNELTGGVYVAEPNRISTGASLATTVYGFWPGFGQFDRIRHKISPSLSWSYSPQPSVSELQDSIFRGPGNLREQNRLSFTFNQTFEARVAEGDADVAAGAEGGERGAEGAENGAEGAAPGEPRRLPRSRTINLLSISTSPGLLYDFVAAREEGRGFLTERLSNSIRSDLVPGLQLNMEHELFEHGEAPADGGPRPRSFSPFLTSLSTGFAIDQDFWLFRALGLGGGDGGAALGEGEDPRDRDAEIEEQLDPERGTGRVGSTIRGAGAGSLGPRAAPGGWRASLNYSLVRRRPDARTFEQTAQQVVRGDVSFQPTEHWSVNWSTGYNITDNEFSDHFLTLSRDLHRWTANFHFIRAQNGNFAMRFSVHLRDQPDLKLDYDQHTTGVDRRRAQSQF